MWRKITIGALLIVSALFVWNSSLLAGRPKNGETRIIAHRGVHQTFHRDGLTNETCTAERIDAPRHSFLENTLPSMQAAFEAGADVVEIDLLPTTDGQLALFHDWTIDCRTEGQGVARDQTLATLQALDIGYGYTADNGLTFPFRGKGIGLMPTLDEVLENFPDQHFLINFKSRDAEEADLLATVLAAHPDADGAIWSAYGAPLPVDRFNALLPGRRPFSTSGVMDCLLQYLALGWSGYVPAACRNTHVMVPGNLAFMLWGWPHRFTMRLAEAGSTAILIGPVTGGSPGTTGIDTEADLALIPAGFDGLVWTNRVEEIAPLLAARSAD